MTDRPCRFLVLGVSLLLAACATSPPPVPGAAGGDDVPEAGCRVIDQGEASYYADKFHGRRTASGERFDNHAMTGAHRTLPFGTHVVTVNRNNGKRVRVRINDRGPFIKGRVIDLSKAAARQIDMIGPGLAPVIVKQCDD